jgi:hypothetical protein
MARPTAVAARAELPMCTPTLNTEAHELLQLSYSLGEGLCHLGEGGGAACVLIWVDITPQGGR